jgi:hypothetical protein
LKDFCAKTIILDESEKKSSIKKKKFIIKEKKPKQITIMNPNDITERDLDKKIT